MGLESGKGNGGMGRNGYRRDYRPQERSGFIDSGADNSAAKGSYASQHPKSVDQNANSSPQTVISGLEKRLSGMQQDFTQAIHKISEKENEKFDLIFAILSELQSRQAQLEESVRALKNQYSGGQMVSASSGPTHVSPQQQQQQVQHGQFGGNNGCPQTYGQMNGQMTGNVASQQPMQQFAGTMQPDGSQAMFAAMPQVVVVSSPTAAGMQYAMPQMMPPSGAMQPMPHQMAMQFMAQNPGQDMGAFSGSQEGTSAVSGGQQRPANSSSGNSQWGSDGNSGTGAPEPQLSHVDPQVTTSPTHHAPAGASGIDDTRTTGFS